VALWHDLSMPSTSVYVSEWVDRPAREVYDYVRDPRNLVHWAHGLGSGVVQVDGKWFMPTPEGQVQVEFAAENPFGVLDHDVTTPSGEVVHVPMRVIPDSRGSEVVFTVRPLPGMTDAELARDAGLVATDLATLKSVLED